MAGALDEYENIMFDIARGIYKAYVQRFIKKNYVTVPREEFAVIRECHSWHLADRAANRISLNQVIRVLNKQSPTHLNHMIRRLKLEQLRQKEQSDPVHSSDQSPVVRKINSTNTPQVPRLILGDRTVQKKQNRSRTATILPRKPLYKPKPKTVTKD